MDLPQIRINSQPALISIQTNNAQQSIQQPKATQQISQPKADVQIEKTPSKLTIDQTQAWNDMGLKSTIVAQEDAAREGYQKVMQGIARRTRQGEQLMKIENNSKPIPNQAIENGHRKQKSFNIGWIPSVFSVSTDYRPAEIDISVQVNQPIINHTPNKPVFQYQRGAVETGIRQEADLQIDFENLKFHGINYEMFI
ncbi:DUF6470 family protein [Paraliobacillus ryukyuensis]|uniref:DUF6470 family protein n=1 Tax=Paraliobacillus ryukyuensis TaxID=200904 RepID=UPI0009A77211|nr:DUF6470 family protein [Paraliobacillus ryukyuensis]